MKEEYGLNTISEEDEDENGKENGLKTPAAIANSNLTMFPTALKAYQASQSEIDDIIKDLNIMEE